MYELASLLFKPMDGKLEAAVAEAAQSDFRPRAVLQVLTAAMVQSDGTAVDANKVANLPIGGIRFLMSRLARHFGVDHRWITADCISCRKPFDFQVTLGDLPLYDTGAEEDVVETSIGMISIRQPKCEDQIVISKHMESEREIILLSRCTEQDVESLSKLNEADLHALDAAMAELSPSLPTVASAACPECGHLNSIPINTSDWLSDLGDGPLEDVHTIASHYGWIESEILALSRKRRQTFIRLIEKSRGYTQVDG